MIYYSLRRTHPRIADFANLMSVAGFAAWNAVLFWDWARADGRFLLGILGMLGLVATELAIRVTRQTEEEGEQATTVAGPPTGEL